MKCPKVSFESSEQANERSVEINKQNKDEGSKKKRLRPYKCQYCSKWHLTSMNKKKFQHKQKLKTDRDYLREVKRNNFIKRESDHWIKKLGL
jgi:formate dehydrogenase assembly factor FdhD